MDSQTQLNDHPNIKKVVSMESFVFLAIFLAVFGLLASKMGMINMLNTMMQTAYHGNRGTGRRTVRFVH